MLPALGRKGSEKEISTLIQGPERSVISGGRWEEVGGGGRRWEEVGGGGRRWEEVGGGGRRWEEVGGGGRRWEEVGGGGRRWEVGGGRGEVGGFWFGCGSMRYSVTVLLKRPW